MQASRKKWLLLGAFAIVVGACTVFLLRVTPGANPPAAARKTAPQPKPGVETPDHELKALAVELEKKPGHVPVLMRMAQIERDKGNLAGAASHLQEAVKTEPGNADARLELGRVLYEKGDVGSAIAQTEKILESNPNQVDALYNLGAIYANLGNAERARSYWKRAVAAGAGAESGRKAKDALAKLGGI